MSIVYSVSLNEILFPVENLVWRFVDSSVRRLVCSASCLVGDFNATAAAFSAV